MNFSLPIEAAFGRYLQAFHAMLVGTTPSLTEFAARDFSKCAVWAPGRMIDQAEMMLEAWRKNDTSQVDRPTPMLPIMIAAASKDYMPVSPDLGRQLADPVWVQLPGDTKGRAFLMRAAVCEIRVQVLICAAEKPTARSIAGQLALYCEALERRRFYSLYRLVGLEEKWPVQLEVPDIISVNVPNDVKNLTMLAADFTLHATVPMLMHPADGAADADGKGSGTQDDPDGYLVVIEAQAKALEDQDSEGVNPMKTWTVT